MTSTTATTPAPATTPASTTPAAFTVGSIVKARGRDWVVLPAPPLGKPALPRLLYVKPLGGSDDEATALHLDLEKNDIRSSTFAAPTVDELGDARSGQLLRDALRLGFRASAGPFRALGNISVEPRPYQLVPLLLALKQDPVRLLIADDVGIGKTIEASLIARELLDRGEIRTMAVLCPPHLAEQWQNELWQKFNIDAALLLPSTAARLERNVPVGQSLFDVYPCMVISIDFIKSDRRRDDFLRHAPDLILVDEAHTCASGQSIQQRGAASQKTAVRSSQHQRHELLKRLVEGERGAERHLLLLTATPHSGDETAFRSLLTLLNADFAQLPDDLSGDVNKPHREAISRYFVQRRRADLRRYFIRAHSQQTHSQQAQNEELPSDFPARFDGDEKYKLTPIYRDAVEKTIQLTRRWIEDSRSDGDQRKQRVHWWAALGLLRALASSPAAAAQSLQRKSALLETDSAEAADVLAEPHVLDIDDTDERMISDEVIGTADEMQQETLAMIKALATPQTDQKLKLLQMRVRELLDDGFLPVVFCRFIATAHYVGNALKNYFEKQIKNEEYLIEVVTGEMPPEERESVVERLSSFEGKRILVATDCLSEGINLQRAFSAVVHYDLAWNPTRHEQRAGRVDRYGQPARKVKVLTIVGEDNRIDSIVQRVLYEKQRAIRNALGVNVPVPSGFDAVLQEVLREVLFPEEKPQAQQISFFDINPALQKKVDTLWSSWAEQQKQDSAALRWINVEETERQSQGFFVHRNLRFEDVAQVIDENRAALGEMNDVKRFVEESIKRYGGSITAPSSTNGAYRILVPNEQCNVDNDEPIVARFQMPVYSDEQLLLRTHPLVTELARRTLEQALDGNRQAIAKRAGVIRTKLVNKRTTLFLLRMRFHLLETQTDAAKRTYGAIHERQLLAEDAAVLSFVGGAADVAQFAGFSDDSNDLAQALLDLQPDANIDMAAAKQFLSGASTLATTLQPHFEEYARSRGQILLNQHRRVRDAAKRKGIKYDVALVPPVDIVGVYVYLPTIS